jgi:hypothetical protein
MSVTLISAEKQARYRERHLGIDGEKVRVGLNLNAGTRAKLFLAPSPLSPFTAVFGDQIPARRA